MKKIKGKILFVDDVFKNLQYILIENKFEVYIGEKEAAFQWASSGVDSPDIIIGEFINQSEALEFLHELKVVNYWGLIYILVPPAIMDVPFIESCSKLMRRVSVINNNIDPLIIFSLLQRDLQKFYNPIYLPINLN